MTPQINASTLLIVASLMVSLLFMLVPLPTWAATARPAFYPATALFWALMLPGSFGVISAWICGLLLDVVLGTPLGQHALALALAAFLVLRMRELLWTFPVFQQGAALLPIFLVYEFVLFWIDGVNGRQVDPLWRWLPALSTTLIWPFWCLLLERFAADAVKG